MSPELQNVYAELLARQPENKMEPRLDPLRQACDLLGNPQNAYRVIHITGTNGKTSTARMIESLIREHNLKTGRYTSPHLESITERISIDGEAVDEETFCEVYEDIKPYLQMVDEQLKAEGENILTFFETITILGFAIFAHYAVDVAIVEVGLGGKWDATNIVKPDVAVFTPIDLDHTEVLGDTVEEIAEEKAGIIKEDAFVISAVQDRDVAQILLDTSQEKGAQAFFEGVQFGVTSRTLAVGGQLLDFKGLAGDYPHVLVPLFGEHQAQNAAVALAAVEAFIGGGQKQLSTDIVEEGFLKATSPGRIELLRSAPTIMIDAAHNPAGAKTLATTLKESFNFTRIIGIVAVLQGKDARGIFEELKDTFDEVIVTESQSPRAIPTEELEEYAYDVFDERNVSAQPKLDTAIEMAVEAAEADGELSGAVVACGSITLIGEVKTLLGTRK
ncbi:MAG: folylpolyglutamate synthase/dihydrofolate synthase family protein [Micrococcaceae bacterium]